jgi:tetratricopeptide (TPR) repeat protein
MCREYCLRIGTSLMFSRYDDEQSLENAKQLIETAQPTDASVCPVFLYPGIQLYREALEAGEVSEDVWEASHVAMPPEAFSGYPEKYHQARELSDKFRAYYNRIRSQLQYSTSQYETAWKKYAYPTIGMKLAFHYTDNGRFADAYEILNRIDQGGYRHHDVWAGKARCLLEQGKRDTALKTLSEWEQQHPSSRLFRLRKGMLLEQAGLYDEAIEEYTKLRNPIDGGYEELLRIANVYEKANDAVSASETYADILERFHIYSKKMRHFVESKLQYVKANLNSCA